MSLFTHKLILNRVREELALNLTVGSAQSLGISTYYGGGLSALSSTRALLAYKDGAADHAKARVLTVSGTTVTSGGELTINAANSGTPALALIGTDKAIAVWKDNTASAGEASVLSMSGNTVTQGAVLSLGENYPASIAALDVDKAVFCSGTQAFVLSATGTTLTVGSGATFNSSYGIYPALVKIDANKMLVAYADSDNSNYLTAVVLTISDTTITVGSKTVIDLMGAQYISACVVNSGLVAISYANNTGYTVKLALASVSDTTVTAGSNINVYNYLGNQTTVSLLDGAHVVVAYKASASGDDGKMTVVDLSGPSIGTTVTFETGAATQISSTIVGQSMLVCYADQAASYAGRAVVAYDA